jgi:hypothetical protein
MILAYPSYWASIKFYAGLLQADALTWEIQDNFLKQTYRNRCYIYGPNGKQMLSVPLFHTIKDRKPLSREMQIDYKDDWRSNHLRSLDTAYNASPFYEFYKDEIHSLLSQSYSNLLELNLQIHDWVMKQLQEEIPNDTSEDFQTDFQGLDARDWVLAKKDMGFDQEAYVQPFAEKLGFISNLSILDLLCNLGPESASYLLRQKL